MPPRARALVRLRLASVWLMLAIVALASLGAAQTLVEPNQDGEPATLYLTGPKQGSAVGNFSARPPTTERGVQMSPVLVDPTSQRIEWDWFFDRLPATTELKAGTSVEVVAFLSRLSFTAPSVDPTAAGQIVVRATLIANGLGGTFAAGTTTLAPAPGESAEVLHELRFAFQTDRDVVLPAHAGGATEQPILGLVITVEAVATNNAPPFAHVAGNATSARLSLPGFPIGALAAWQDAEDDRARCLERVLQQEPCEPAAEALGNSGEPTNPPLLGGIPGVGFLVLVAGLSVGAIAVGRRIVP